MTEFTDQQWRDMYLALAALPAKDVSLITRALQPDVKHKLMRVSVRIMLSDVRSLLNGESNGG